MKDSLWKRYKGKGKILSLFAFVCVCYGLIEIFGENVERFFFQNFNIVGKIIS